MLAAKASYTEVEGPEHKAAEETLVCVFWFQQQTRGEWNTSLNMKRRCASAPKNKAEVCYLHWLPYIPVCQRVLPGIQIPHASSIGLFWIRICDLICIRYLRLPRVTPSVCISTQHQQWPTKRELKLYIQPFGISHLIPKGFITARNLTNLQVNWSSEIWGQQSTSDRAMTWRLRSIFNSINWLFITVVILNKLWEGNWKGTTFITTSI